MSDGSTFGVELRRARLVAGLSLTELSAKVHYSKGYLSKLENGTGTPTAEVARRFDATLDAGGRLAATVPGPRPPSAPTRPVADPAPTAGVRAFALAGGDDSTLSVLETMFDHARELGRRTSPAVVLPPLAAQIGLLRAIAAAAGPPGHGRLLSLAARSAEYAGWMAQEQGDDPAARSWTELAIELARAAGDQALVRYGLVRQAELDLYRRHLGAALSLLAGALAGPPTARVSGLATQWKAQAHALDGDRARSLDTLDRAAELLRQPDETGGSAFGSLSVPNLHALVTGWCLLELGQPEQAAEVLDREVPAVPAASRRSAARFGATRAIAHAAAGDPDAALALLPDLLVLVAQVDSATVRLDLRRLRRELVRWEARPAVAGARTDLADALLPY